MKVKPGATGDHADLLVVGSGIAGCIAAMETRRYAPEARIVLVTEQNHPTINTPALKQFGAGRLEPEHLLAYAAGTERKLRIDVIHQRAMALEPSGHRVLLADGHCIKYERLLLATGTEATPLPSGLPGRTFDGVITLHGLHDYLDLRRRLPTVSSAVVIGGGYHAAETAMLLRHQRAKVTWLIRGRGILPRQLDQAASDLLLRQVRRQGVDIRLETEVAGVVGRLGVAAGVVTSSNEFIACELVVAAIGTQPETALAAQTPIVADSNHGIRVTDRLQTTARDIYAAGAVAALRDPQSGQFAARGQWYFAVQQGRLAAAVIAGVPVSSDAAMGAVGNFWHATQFDKLHVVVAGAPMLGERAHPENETLTNGSGAFYRRIVVRHGHLVGYLAVTASPPPGLTIKRLIDERINIDEIKRKLLTDDFDLRSFFTQRRLHALDTGETSAVLRPVEDITRAQPILDGSGRLSATGVTGNRG
jgi:NAD(P)H-nitrite reductase large subunit